MKRILNYVGSKWNLSKWIISQMPEHEVYLEPFLGSGAVMFNKKRSDIETVNDIDGNIANLFKVIREQPDDLSRMVKLTPYSRQEYLQSFSKLESDLTDIERARVFLVRCWMARGGKTSDRTGWRHNVNPSTINAVPDWLGVPNTIKKATQRLQGVQIESMDAVELIDKYNREDCLIYADPPYLLETRTKRHYANEMTIEEHESLLNQLSNHSGFVMLSGYESDMYNDVLSGWTKTMKMATTDAANKRQEILWLNPRISERGHAQGSIFEVI